MFSSGIYAILDGDRLGLVTPASVRDALPLLTELAVAAREAGAVALQLRLKSLEKPSVVRGEVAAVLLRALAGQLPLIVNDDAESAGRAGAGLHLGQGDGEVGQARMSLGESALIGWSTHNLEQVRAGNDVPCNYIGFGPILWTASKSALDPVTGWAHLTDACAASQRPVVAIGGLGAAQATLVRATGAHAMAVISGWLGAQSERPSAESAYVRLRELVAAWQAGGTP